MSETQPEDWQDQEQPLEPENPVYDEGYEPPPVHGVHATKPFVNDAGALECSVCGQEMLHLAPEQLEHNTDRR